MEELEIFLQNMLYLLFFCQIVILLIMLGAFFLRKIYLRNQGEKDVELKQNITDEILDCLVNKQKFEPNSNFESENSQNLLLSTMEEFDDRLRGGVWGKVKPEISSKYLLNTARRWANDKSWTRRNFAARSFALTPLDEDRNTILNLMDDPEFLVRGVVSGVAVSEEIKEGVYKILKHMSKAPGYSYYYYRDLLLEGSQLVHSWVEEFGAKEKNNTKFHVACLDVLEHAFYHVTKIDLEEDLHSDNPELQEAALQLLSHNPQADSQELLTEELEDLDPHLRAEAAEGLENFPGKPCMIKLEEALSDENAEVRLKAATALKHMGKAGVNILKKQDETKNKMAYEIAQYAIKFI